MKEYGPEDWRQVQADSDAAIRKLRLNEIERDSFLGLRDSLKKHGFGVRPLVTDLAQALFDSVELNKEFDEALSVEKKAKSTLQRAAAMKRYPGHDVARRIVEEGEELKKQIDSMKRTRVKLEAEWDEAIGGALKWEEFSERVDKLVREIPCPPLDTPGNVETIAMGLAHFLDQLHLGGLDLKKGSRARESLISMLDSKGNGAKKLGRSFWELLQMVGEVESDDVGEFLFAWRRSAYARVEVGHKLAASLCLTDVPEDAQAAAPWEAWSLFVPDGLLGGLSRVWMKGLEAIRYLHRGDQRTLSPVELEMLRSLIFGVALALSNPEDFKKERHHKPSARSTKGRKGGAPDFEQARFLLSAPIEVDFREHIKAALDDERAGRRRGSSPKVQFLVRGHWRRQAHGAGRLERKTIWIKPFWKGPEESRVLLRSHKVEG